MKKISYWAQSHRPLTRILIVLSYLLLNVLGIITGKLLSGLAITLPFLVLDSCILLLIVAGLVYPMRYHKMGWMTRHRSYMLQKTCDSVLITSTFLIIVFAGNHYGNLSGLFTTTTFQQEAMATSVKDSTQHSYKTLEAFKLSMKDKDGKMLKWKERKKLLKTQLKAIRKSDELSPAAKGLLTLLCVVVAAGLLYLVAAGACSLSCSGAEGAAFLVGFGGLAVVIFLLIISLRAIYKKKPKPVPVEGTKPPDEVQKSDGD